MSRTGPGRDGVCSMPDLADTTDDTQMEQSLWNEILPLLGDRFIFRKPKARLRPPPSQLNRSCTRV